MKEITPDILIETEYEGVTVGVIRTPEGICMIDFPLLKKDIQAWHTICTRSGVGPKRISVLLDAHPDRAGGFKDNKNPIITHAHTEKTLRGRPSITKMQGMETGNIWELIPEIAALDWPKPEITFSKTLSISWQENPIIIENHPGPTPGALWVDIPDHKVLFVGDAITSRQPPFLFSADISPWIENLESLKKARYKDYTIISGRNGLVSSDDIRFSLRFLKKALRAFERLDDHKADLTKVQKTAISYMKDFKSKNKSEEEIFRNRLSYGFSKYYINHYSKNR